MYARQIQNGYDLVCERHPYADELRERIKPVELAVDRVDWTPTHRRSTDQMEVRFRLQPRVDLMRRAVLFAGGQ